MAASFAELSPQKRLLSLGILSVLLTIMVVFVTSLLRHSVPVQLPLAVATAMFSFAATPLFIMALKDFKHGLRRAYTLLCAGIILYGVAQLQFPLFEIIDGSAWVNSGAVIIPYVLSIGCIFFGVRRFARLVGLKGLILSPWIAVLAAVIVAAISGLIIKGEQATVLQFELFLSTILTFSAIAVLRIRSVTARRYHYSLSLLAATLGVLVFAVFHHLGMAMLLSGDNAYANSGWPLWPPCLAALLFMGVGYSFGTLRSQDAAAPSLHTSPVDVITYIASFASSPTTLDTSLDTLRGITANLRPDTTLTKQQETALANVYNDLEKHLITNEPLQNFTKEGLREMVRTRFQFDSKSPSVFWSLFAE